MYVNVWACSKSENAMLRACARKLGPGLQHLKSREMKVKRKRRRNKTKNGISRCVNEKEKISTVTGMH